MNAPLRVLLVEDSEDDALLVMRELRRIGYEVVFNRVETAADMELALGEQTWDIIIADYSMPRFSGIAALELLGASRLDVPFIIVSGTIGEDIAVGAMRAGAHDYVLKDNLTRLGPAVQRELREAETRRARRRAEQQLRESEARYRQSVENSPNPIFAIDRQGLIQMWNRACEQVFQYQSAEMVDQPFRKLLWNPEDHASLKALVAQVWQGHTLSERDIQYRCKDGAQRFAVSRLYPLRGDEDRVEGCVVANTDITERKRAERESEERRRYLERVLAAAPDAIVTLDARRRIVEWNPGAESLFGYQREQAIDQDLDQLIGTTDTMDEAQSLTDQLMGGTDVLPVEVVRHRKDGSSVKVIVAGSPIMVEDKLIGGVVIYTNITARKRAERLLQALNEAALAIEQALTPSEIFTAVGDEFKKLGLSCAIFVLDESKKNLRPRYYSYDSRGVKAAEKLMGVKAEKFSIEIEKVDVFKMAIHEGKSVFAEGNEELKQVLPNPLKRFTAQVVKLLKVPKSIAAPLVVEDETIGLLSVQSDNLTADDIPAITAFAHQMSAAWRKANLMQDLERSLEELQRTQAQFLQAQKMEAVGRLAGGVAHDFNNTLTIIHLSCQLLKRQLRLEDPLWEYVQQIEDAGKRAANLTRQLLSFSRREIIEPRVVDLGQVVAQLSRMLKRIIGEDIELVTALADDLWPVYLDPMQIDQAIINLVVNARDAMPQGGRLTIKTANVLLDELDVTQHLDIEPGEYVTLTVSDTGIGMTEEIQEHIFEPFFTTKEREQGTGLGLSTVFGIVKQNSGDIQVYSEVGQGTTFKIYLPRTQETESQAAPPLPAPSTVRGTETILIVEDDAIVRDLAVQILGSHGYQVLTASSGPDALEFSKEYHKPIHLLLTDMVMPQMSGRELAEAIQSQRSQTRVLFMSGHSDSMIAHHGALQGGMAFLSKPFTVESLTQQVRSVLDTPLAAE